MKNINKDIPVWLYKDIIDPGFLEHLKTNITQTYGKVRVELSDGFIVAGVRQVFWNLFYWKILLSFGIPIQKRHFIKRVGLNNDTLMESLTPYYEEIIAGDKSNAKKLKLVLWELIQEMYFFVSTQLGEYVGTIDILSLSRILHDKKMHKIVETKKEITPDKGSNVLEKFISAQSEQMMKLIGTPGALQDDCLLPYQNVKQLNKFQFPQIMYAYGVRTDINDSIIGYPVQGSAIDGLRNIWEFAVESLSAKKALAYNHHAVRKSQYFGRKNHLLAAILQHVYNSDCGSTLYVNYQVTKENYRNVIGKRINVDGRRVYITADNIKDFIGKKILMRSPMTCRYRTGVCEACGGLIYRNINRRYNLGIISAIQVIEPTTQKILSSKHLIKTDSIVYQLPKDASEFFIQKGVSEIWWNAKINNKLDKIQLGIPAHMFSSIHDVKLIRTNVATKEEKFSQVSGCVLKMGNRKIDVSLENPAIIPCLSMHMLIHIRDFYKFLTIEDDIVWIPLEGTDKYPIFRVNVINDNMLQFVERVNGFLSKTISTHTTCEGALKEFSDIVHSKVSVNITHLETLLKAYEITSLSDYRIPFVTDVDNVMFGTTDSIMDNRNIGGLLAYQGLSRYVRNPSSYLVKKQSSPWDIFVGSFDNNFDTETIQSLVAEGM